MTAPSNLRPLMPPAQAAKFVDLLGEMIRAEINIGADTVLGRSPERHELRGVVKAKLGLLLMGMPDPNEPEP